MEITINYWAVLVSGISAMVLGSLWYGPLFGKQWMALIHTREEDVDSERKKGMMKSYGLMFAGALVMAYVLAHALLFASTYTQTAGLVAGLMVAFWNWLGFIAPVTMGSILWEGKSWKLWLLNNSYQLLSLMIMGVILAYW